jgi:hypothetical protein
VTTPATTSTERFLTLADIAEARRIANRVPQPGPPTYCGLCGLIGRHWTGCDGSARRRALIAP